MNKQLDPIAEYERPAFPVSCWSALLL